MNAITEVNFSSAKRVDYTPIQKAPDAVTTEIKQSVTTVDKSFQGNIANNQNQRPQSDSKQNVYSEKNKAQDQNISFVQVSENTDFEETTEINLFEASKAYQEEKSKQNSSSFSLSGELQVEKFIPPVPITEIKAPEITLAQVQARNKELSEANNQDNYGIAQ